MTRAPLRADRSAMITGIGAVTPLGNDFDTIADGLLAGRSGVVEIDGEPVRACLTFAASVAVGFGAIGSLDSRAIMELAGLGAGSKIAGDYAHEMVKSVMKGGRHGM